ncbi:unnamed protein product [Effrenium voratum]|uniref:CobW/HypB/UreG nucleotide-binding domain-containing protein n=1 Tax=Effrenium voratum TaxID=2562239 RepID=A0AA36I427_9DINO|nr:unnamed protein product [Effrenium voratum]
MKWWTSYALQEDEVKEDRPKEQPLAFDKEAQFAKTNRSRKDPARDPTFGRSDPMALACGTCEWREKHRAAQSACKESRFFEAVQLINCALEALEQQIPEAKHRPALLLTEPQTFAEELQGSLGEHAPHVAELWATRADILMNLGGLKRASGELAAAALLAPEVPRIQELQAECRKLERYQEEGIAEEAATAAQGKVPAHILTGFLGSGKTTLLNHILQETSGRRFAVIENEFGEIGIDDKLIARREDLGAEQIIEMNNGCICCTVRGDLIQGLRSILKKTSLEGTKLDGVIIETTGLADPAPVAQTFFADDLIQAKMTLDGIITVVDAKHCLQHLREEKPEGVENEAVEQLAFADRIIVNKTDLVSESEIEELTKEVRSINRLAPMIYTQKSKVKVEEIIGIRGFSLDRVLDSDAEFLRDDQDHQHDQTVSSVARPLTGGHRVPWGVRQGEAERLDRQAPHGARDRHLPHQRCAGGEGMRRALCFSRDPYDLRRPAARSLA